MYAFDMVKMLIVLAISLQITQVKKAKPKPQIFFAASV